MQALWSLWSNPAGPFLLGILLCVLVLLRLLGFLLLAIIFLDHDVLLDTFSVMGSAGSGTAPFRLCQHSITTIGSSPRVTRRKCGRCIGGARRIDPSPNATNAAPALSTC